MKKLLFVLIVLISTSAFAKKVKFAVDMTGQTVNPLGVHIGGDFQTVAGFGLNFESGTTPLTQEGATDIYSIIVEIPAHANYTYKFINGDQWYDAEFVPVQSRVGYNFDDNRWLYVDSIANDTTFAGAILFGGNAPAGLTFIRFLVDMQNQTVANTGVHLAGNFQDYSTTATMLYNLDNSSMVYEIISYVVSNSNNYEFKYYNGNSINDAETVPGTCAVNDYRNISVATDTVLEAVCFSSCTSCTLTALAKTKNISNVNLFPNPANEITSLTLPQNNTPYNISIYDALGRKLVSYNNYTGANFIIEKNDFSNGVYFVNVSSNDSNTTLKLIFQ